MDRRLSLFLCTLQPRLVSSSPQTEISERLGTPLRIVFPGARIEAAIMGREAFFEPLVLMVPASLTGPSMRNISIVNFPCKEVTNVIQDGFSFKLCGK